MCVQWTYLTLPALYALQRSGVRVYVDVTVGPHDAWFMGLYSSRVWRDKIEQHFTMLHRCAWNNVPFNILNATAIEPVRHADDLPKSVQVPENFRQATKFQEFSFIGVVKFTLNSESDWDILRDYMCNHGWDENWPATYATVLWELGNNIVVVN